MFWIYYVILQDLIVIFGLVTLVSPHGLLELVHPLLIVNLGSYILYWKSLLNSYFVISLCGLIICCYFSFSSLPSAFFFQQSFWSCILVLCMFFISCISHAPKPLELVFDLVAKPLALVSWSRGCLSLVACPMSQDLRTGMDISWAHHLYLNNSLIIIIISFFVCATSWFLLLADSRQRWRICSVRCFLLSCLTSVSIHSLSQLPCNLLPAAAAQLGVFIWWSAFCAER